MEHTKEFPCGKPPEQGPSPKAEEMLALLERRGIVANTEISSEKRRQMEQALRKNIYHNTQLMLKSYRDIVWALECFPERVAEELNAPLENLDRLLGMVDLRLALEDAKLEHKLLSIKKSRLLLDRVNDALTVLRQKPGNGEQMYSVIYQTFITPDKLSHANILYRLNLSDRHYYRLRQQAVNILSIRLWTAPTGCLDAWLEVLTLLEDI